MTNPSTIDIHSNVTSRSPIFSAHSNRNEFIKDVVAGGTSGFITGAIVSFPEALKVHQQTLKPGKSIPFRQMLPTLVKMTPSFSLYFSAVCAIECSVNERVKAKYGATAGVGVSALTGAFFLTVADHLMFLKKQGEANIPALRRLTTIHPTAPWTGFVPMIGREAIYIASVMHFGPMVARLLNGDSTQDAGIAMNLLGRFLTGLPTTVLSQPFDATTRLMQIRLTENPIERPGILSSYNGMTGKQALEFVAKGAVPRLGLATFGGMMVGLIFDEARKHLSQFEEVSAAPQSSSTNFRKTP